MKKLKRVKLKRKMKNVVSKKNVDYKHIFDTHFKNEGKDYLNKIFESAKRHLAVAVKKRDKKECLLYLRVLDEIASASIFVAENVAIISSPNCPDKVFTLNKNSIHLNDKEFVFTDAT